MDKELRFKIISEGLKNGVSDTCRKYNISRTIYYRWLKRYKTQGLDGLESQKKTFTPPNKTSLKVEKVLLNLIYTYPTYGPKALKYLLDEMGYKIGESAVFNILKRNDLTNKSNRLKYVNKKNQIESPSFPPISTLKSGECWIFWITDFGYYKDIGHVYGYNLLDLKSLIACSRLYTKISFSHFEELLTGVALSVATSLNLQINYLCLFKDRKILKYGDSISKSKIHTILHNYGYETKIHFLDQNDPREEIPTIKAAYVEKNISFLIPLINEGMSFSSLKRAFQDHLRKYNIIYKIQYGHEWYSPIGYHNKCTNTQMILPIWAYMDRDY